MSDDDSGTTATPHRGPAASVQQLVDIMASLRADDGCPWDREQTHASLRPFLIEEAYEFMEAVERGDDVEMTEELGDLLLQIVFHAQIGSERGAFDFNDVHRAIADKMLRRHPHVFGDSTAADTADVAAQWDAIKRSEGRSVLGGVPLALPALLRARKLSSRASRVGFDWPDVDGVIEKVEEELRELKEARAADDRAGVVEELGDLLFSVANLGRVLKACPEEALQAANRKFVRRFEFIERACTSQDTHPSALDSDALEALWNQAKQDENS